MSKPTKDLIDEAIKLSAKINRKLATLSKAELGDYYSKEMKSNITNNHMFTKTGNLSKSRKMMEQFSEPMLKIHIEQMNDLLNNNHFKSVKKAKAYIENTIAEEMKKDYEFKRGEIQNFKMTMKERYGNDFDLLVKSVYGGEIEEFYKDFVRRKESHYLDLAMDSDDVFDNIYNDNRQTIEHFKKESTQRTMRDVDERLFELKQNAPTILKNKQNKMKKGKIPKR